MKKAVAVIPETPRIFMRDGELLTNSVEVAKDFDKRHQHVLDQIDSMLEMELDLAGTSFRRTTYLNPKNSQIFRCFEMDEQGFMLLVMGFTGLRAFKMKLQYTRQWKAMKDALMGVAPQVVPQISDHSDIDIEDSAFMAKVMAKIHAKLTVTEERLQIAHVEIAEARTEIAVVKTQLAIAAPKVKFYDKYMDSEGHIILSDAAKALGLGHRKFFRRLVEAKIMFYRDPERKRKLRASKRYEEKGYFVLKGGVAKSNNYSFLHPYLTPSGLEFLSVFFERVDLFNQLQLEHAD